MRLLAPLFAVLLPCLAVQAEESVNLPLLQPSSAGTSQTSTAPAVELRQQLQLMQAERDQLQAQLQEQKQFEEQKQLQESAQVSRLRQENQRLKLQLKEAQASPLPRLLTDQQQWFVIGGAVALVALLCGIFASGGHRKRRQWLN